LTSRIITSEAGAILLGVVAAVDLVVDANQRPVGRDARHAELLVAEADDARLQHGEIVGIARRERQRLDLRFGQRAALLDAAEIHERRIGRHRDRLLELPDGHLDVQDCGAPGGQDDPGLLVGAKPLQLGRHPVRAQRQQRGAEHAAFVADDGPRVARIGVRDGDRHARQHRTLVVDDGAFDGGVDRLRLAEGWRSKRQDHTQRRQNPRHGCLRGQ
jgi:hypothetical protein